MKKLLRILGIIKEEKEMSLDEYIISIRPQKRQLSRISVQATKKQKDNKNDNDGPEEAGYMIPA